MRVFVSYSRADSEFVDGQLVSLLRRIYGAENIMYDDDIHAGENWWPSLVRKITDCDIFLPVISTSFCESRYCHQEVDEALRLGKPLLPVLIGSEIDMPARLNHIQYVKVEMPISADSLAELERGIRNLISGTQPISAPPKPVGNRRRWLLLGVAGLLVIAIAVILFGFLMPKEAFPYGQITSLRDGQHVPPNITVQGQYDPAQLAGWRLWVFVVYDDIYYPQCDEGCCTGSHQTVTLNSLSNTWQTGAVVGMPYDSGKQFSISLMAADTGATARMFDILDNTWCPTGGFAGLPGSEMAQMGFTELQSIPVWRQ